MEEYEALNNQERMEYNQSYEDDLTNEEPWKD